MVTTVLDWAASRDLGFSSCVSLGNMADVDFGDMLDYLANDPDTDAILLYIEAITHARKFMSAARSAARVKPSSPSRRGAATRRHARRLRTPARLPASTRFTTPRFSARAFCGSTISTRSSTRWKRCPRVRA